MISMWHVREGGNIGSCIVVVLGGHIGAPSLYLIFNRSVDLYVILCSNALQENQPNVTGCD